MSIIFELVQLWLCCSFAVFVVALAVNTEPAEQINYKKLVSSSLLRGAFYFLAFVGFIILLAIVCKELGIYNPGDTAGYCR